MYLNNPEFDAEKRFFSHVMIDFHINFSLISANEFPSANFSKYSVVNPCSYFRPLSSSQIASLNICFFLIFLIFCIP